MDSGRTVTLAMGLLPGYIIAVVIYATSIKWVQRNLTFTQSLMIAGVAVAISFALLVACFVAPAGFYRNGDVDNLVCLFAFCLTGIVITRLARNYGVQKVGWLGVGARVNLWLWAASCIIIFLVLGVQYLFSS